MQTVFIFLIVIIVLVVVHELGHFFVAKFFGVRVDEFGVGYPPRARKLFTWRGTLFTLNWLPFGGFVKIYGEESAEENTRDSFLHQKLWKRVAVVLAGIVANLLLAIVLYGAAFNIGFFAEPGGQFPAGAVISQNETMITSVAKDSPAQKAGFIASDRITAIATKGDTTIPENVTDVVLFVKKHPTDVITFTLFRGNKTKSIQVTPSIDQVTQNPSVGISLAEVVYVKVPFLYAIRFGGTYTVMQFVVTLHSVGSLLSSSFGGGHSLIAQVSGPVGIAQVAGEAYSLGFGSFLAFVALISVNLAVINILPFPALDGGRCILEFFSKNGRSRIPKKVVSTINQVSFLLLIVLMLYVTYHDIIRLFL
jgi:regulator of sigma E protease